MTANPSTPAHLAELEARYEAHLAALRQHAAQLQATVARQAAELADRVEPAPAAPDDALLRNDPI